MGGRHRKPAPPRLRQFGVAAATSACAGGMVTLPGTASAAVPTDQTLDTGPSTVLARRRSRLASLVRIAAA
ncbi:MAG: hypothetical protein ACRDRZ_02170 [Pseudonocardiaceae bacterium]